MWLLLIEDGQTSVCEENRILFDLPVCRMNTTLALSCAFTMNVVVKTDKAGCAFPIFAIGTALVKTANASFALGSPGS